MGLIWGTTDRIFERDENIISDRIMFIIYNKGTTDRIFERDENSRVYYFGSHNVRVQLTGFLNGMKTWNTGLSAAEKIAWVQLTGFLNGMKTLTIISETLFTPRGTTDRIFERDENL